MFAEFARSIDSDYRVIAPDLYAHGLTKEASASPLTYDSAARGILAALDDMEIKDFELVGQSMGADIGLHIALLAPKRVKSMVLLGAGCGAMPEDRLPALTAWIEEVEGNGFRVQDQDRALHTLLGRSTIENLEQHTVVDRVSASLARNDISVASAMIAVFTRSATCSRLSSLEIPTLVMTGDEDTARPIQTGEILAQSITGSDFQVISKCGHTPVLESFATVLIAIREFWGTLGAYNHGG